MMTTWRRAGGLTALLLSCGLALPPSGAAQGRMSSVSIIRDELEPCVAFDPTGELAECADSGALFEASGHASVPPGGSPTLTLSAMASVAGDAGAPLFEGVGAQAMLHDLVTVSGAGVTARVTLTFRVTGALVQQSPPDASATLQVDLLGDTRVWSADQAVDETISVTVDVPAGAVQDLTLFGSARASVARPSAASAGGLAAVGVPAAVSVRLEGVRITDQAGAVIEGASLASALGYEYPPLPGPGGGLSLGPAILWLGLGDADGGGPVDVRAEVHVNQTLVAAGEVRCLADLGERPRRPREVAVDLGASAGADAAPGDVLALRVLARVGTNPDGTPCAGLGARPSRSKGLRVYYDSADLPSRLGIELAGEEPGDLFLRSDGRECKQYQGLGPGDDPVLVLDPTAPSADLAKCRESGDLHLDGGNPWSEVDTWSTTLP
jgi:hypothetical protein